MAFHRERITYDLIALLQLAVRGADALLLLLCGTNEQRQSQNKKLAIALNVPPV